MTESLSGNEITNLAEMMILCVRKRTFIKVANVCLDTLWAWLAISSKKEILHFSTITPLKMEEGNTLQ